MYKKIIWFDTKIAHIEEYEQQPWEDFCSS